MKDLPSSKPSPKQGQVLAYIYYYTKLNRRPPAEADIGAFFGTMGPSTHQMIIRLEDGGFI
jgi:repressor LexA